MYRDTERCRKHGEPPNPPHPSWEVKIESIIVYGAGLGSTCPYEFIFLLTMMVRILVSYFDL